MRGAEVQVYLSLSGDMIVEAGWAAVTFEDADYSEATELDSRRRKPPRGC